MDDSDVVGSARTIESAIAKGRSKVQGAKVQNNKNPWWGALMKSLSSAPPLNPGRPGCLASSVGALNGVLKVSNDQSVSDSSVLFGTLLGSPPFS